MRSVTLYSISSVTRLPIVKTGGHKARENADSKIVPGFTAIR
jgi:hypothetical protein